MGVVNVQSLLQHGQYAVLFDLLVQPLQHHTLPVGPVFQFRQFLGLGRFEKFPKELAVNRELPVKVSRIANAIAVLRKCCFDVRFKRGFVGLADHVVPLCSYFSSNYISYQRLLHCIKLINGFTLSPFCSIHHFKSVPQVFANFVLLVHWRNGDLEF